MTWSSSSPKARWQALLVQTALGAALSLGLVPRASAQTAPVPDPASPQAPASVIAPPRPTPGDGQSRALHRRLVMQAFEEADRDRNGQLSREEAASLPGLPERFEQVDSNRDGQISRQELQAAGGP